MRRSEHGNYARAARGICVFLLVAMLLPLLFTATAPEPASAWIDPAWTRRRPVTITAAENGMPENYQVRIFVVYDADMQPDFDDLRFYLTDDVTVLPYWIENYNLGENAAVWVRLPFSLLASASANIYMYYSNPAATSAENGDATFDFFDTFPGTSLDTTKWAGSTAYASVSSSILTYNVTVAAYHGISSLTIHPISRAVEARMYWAAPAAATDSAFGFFFDGTHFVLFYTNVGGPVAVRTYDTAAGTLNSSDWSTGAWNRYKATRRSGEARFFQNDVEVLGSPITTNVPSDNENVRMECYAKQIQFDWVFVRNFISPEPTVAIGAEEVFGNVIVTNIAADNILIDRDTDWAGSGAKTGTKLQADVEFKLPNFVYKENVRFVIYDKLDAKIDNKAATENLWLADNKQRFFVIYRATDNTLSNAQLGGWDVKVEAYDNAGVYGTLTAFNNFYVSDLTATATIENVPRHRIRVYGAGSRVDGVAVVIENIWLEDNNIGTRAQTLVGNNYDDTYAPEAAGKLHLRLKDENLDGRHPAAPDNISYAFPNFSPFIVATGVTSSQTLVDRDLDYVGSGATLTTLLTIRISDPDNRDDLNAAKMAVRDVLDVVQDNQDVWASRVVVDENTFDVSYTYEPPDSLANTSLGLFDIWGYATDAWSVGENWHADRFTVADGTSSVGFSSANPYIGWPLTVSGTISGIGYTASSDNAWLIDGKHGTWTLGAGNSWSKTYDLTNVLLGENVPVTLLMKDENSLAVIDSEVRSNYIVNPNVLFQIEVRRENDYALWPGIPIENRPMTVRFNWEGGTYAYTLTSNKENVTVLTSGKEPYLVGLYDNEKYWRRRIPTYMGGVLAFTLPPDKSTFNQYVFTIQDYTGKFRSPSGWVSFRKYVDNVLVSVNDDWWDATDKAYAYLVLHDFYQVYLFGAEGAQRHIGHFQAESDFAPSAFVVGALVFGENKIFKWAVVEMEATRDNDGHVWVRFRDQHDNTDNITIKIYTFFDNLQYTATFAYPSEIASEWSSAPVPDNDSSYRILLIVNNREFGSWSEWLVVGPVILRLPYDPPGIGGIIGTIMPLAGLAGLFIIGVIAMSFGAQYASTGMLAIALTALFLKFLSMRTGANFMPLPGGAIILLLVLAAAWKIGEEV